MFSKACEYGLKALVYIATQSAENKRVKIGDIAENTGTPVAFTAKILGTLTKHEFVDSLKGPYGGFEMTKKQRDEIKLSQVVNAIDGDSIYKACSMGMSECSDENPCILHHKYVKVRNEIRKMLETTTISQLAEKAKKDQIAIHI
ncbi:MAG: Rrf2 family transcriptional regulator [Chitinophagales bacterium]|nr:Rrf2 family transcriptional regulator [Bacteroidota bacterium]